MTPLTYQLLAHDLRILGEFDNRYDADRALHAANERAAVHQFHWKEDASEIVNENHNVFPLEPEEKSAWIPVGERLPERETELCSVDVLFTDGEEHHIGYHMQDPPSDTNPDPRQSWWSGLKRSTIPDVSHWQPLPALP